MSLETILIGLLGIVIGLAWAFYGLKAFTILLPLWAFFFGLLAGAQWGADLFGQGFFATVLSWGIGLVFGIVLAAISFFWYYAAIVILGGALGYSLGIGIFEYFGWGTGFIAILVGLIIGAVFAIGTFVLGVPVLLVIGLSAFSGAAAAITGLLVITNQVKLETVDGGAIFTLFHHGVIGTLAWLILAVVAILYQIRDVGTTATTIQQSSYRY
jgi:hypothetical protein